MTREWGEVREAGKMGVAKSTVVALPDEQVGETGMVQSLSGNSPGRWKGIKDIRMIRMLEELEQDPASISKFPAEMRVRLEFGLAIRQIAEVLRCSAEGTQIAFDVYEALEQRLEHAILSYHMADVQRAYKDGRDDVLREIEGDEERG